MWLCVYLVAFLSCSVVAIGVREVDVTGCGLHHLFDVPATFSDDVGVLRECHVHFQRHFINLVFKFRESRTCLHTLWGAKQCDVFANKKKLNKSHFLLKHMYRHALFC